MNDNIDDWLNALGFDNNSSEESPSVPAPVDTPEIQEAPQPQSLSEQDFSDVLEEFGFNHSEEGEAEEVVEEENTEEYNENGGEDRDLDAEEDANWQEAIDSRRVVPRYNYVGDGELSQLRDFRMDPNTGEVQVMTGVGVVTVGTTVQETDMATVENPEPANEQEETREHLIPLNSPTLLMDESTTRFSGAEWFNEIQSKRIIIGGCGGISSNLAFQLARMHPAAMYIYDDDTVETVNMAGQLFSRNDVGKTKVDAISDMINVYTNMQNVFSICEKFTETTEAGDIMMCGFDNMTARKTFFASWFTHVQSKPVEERKNCLFLDGRLSLSDLQVFCISGEDDNYMEQYRDKYLFSDSEADETVCSMKQTTYLACMIGSVMTNLFTNWVANLIDPVIPYDLPFFTEYDAQNMIFKTVK